MCKYLHYTLLWDVLLFILITVINGQNLQLSSQLLSPETLASGTLYEYLVNELFNYGTPRGMQEDTVILDTDMSQNGSTQCQQDVNQMMSDLSQGQMYALNMLDASGKPPPGILEGNILWIGRYDLCRDIKASLTQRDFNGRYCLTMSTAVNKSRTLLPEIGVCVPNSCSADVVNQLILSGVLGTDVLDIPRYNPNTICITDPEYSAAAIAALCICSILGLLNVGGTGISVFRYLRKTIFSTDDDDIDVDGILNQRATQSLDSRNRTESDNMRDTVKDGVIVKTLLCFCAITNGRKILAIPKSGPYSRLAALNGIRVLSMFWVILLHTHQNIPNFTDNPHALTSVYERFSGQVLVSDSATLAVDSFFVLRNKSATHCTIDGDTSMLRRFEMLWSMTSKAFEKSVSTNALIVPDFSVSETNWS
ncbi:nose resistant to fluoxetine protein 6-like [Amphiura filiformis]|uniref:nose resistant to fluoxetine protein 6-like n=1 Tax=Amphiura filiformis TaxID=82378 RepID=UPI003B2207CD